jgi:hypothetical protein
MGDIEIGENKLTVRTVRLELLTGPFILGHLMYLADGYGINFVKVAILL